MPNSSYLETQKVRAIASFGAPLSQKRNRTEERKEMCVATDKARVKAMAASALRALRVAPLSLSLARSYAVRRRSTVRFKVVQTIPTRHTGTNLIPFKSSRNREDHRVEQSGDSL